MKKILVAIDFSGTLSIAHSSLLSRWTPAQRENYLKIVTSECFDSLCIKPTQSLVQFLSSHPEYQTLIQNDYFNPLESGRIDGPWHTFLPSLTTHFPYSFYEIHLCICTDHSIDVVECIRGALSEIDALNHKRIRIACSAEIGAKKSSTQYWDAIRQKHYVGVSFDTILLVDDFCGLEFGEDPSAVFKRQHDTVRALQHSTLKQSAAVSVIKFEGHHAPTINEIEEAIIAVGEEKELDMEISANYDVLIMLNSPEPLAPLDQKLWNESSSSCLKICADGATNRVGIVPPNIVVGDMDSIDPQTKQSPTIIYHPEPEDQDTTDFEKALRYVEKNILPSSRASSFCATKALRIGVLGGFGGRRDHEFALYHALIKTSCRLHNSVQLIARYGSTSVTVLTHTGKTTLRNVPIGSKCGVIPLTGPSQIARTQGLQWELENFWIEMGGAMISTSNIVTSSNVVVDNYHRPVLWVHASNS